MLILQSILDWVMWYYPRPAQGSNSTVNRVTLNNKLKTTPRSWFAKCGWSDQWKQIRHSPRKPWKPSPNGQTQNGANWCRQRNGRLHWFPQPSSAGCKAIMAVEEKIMYTTRNSPTNSHTTHLNIYTCYNGRLSENPNHINKKLTHPVERNGIMSTRAYLELLRD